MKKPFSSYITLTVIAILAMTAAACGSDKNLKKGEKYLAIGEYYDAASQFKQAYSKTSPKDKARRGEIAVKIAHCNERINATQKALAAYGNAIRYDKATTTDRLCYARQLLKSGAYKQAEELFREVLDSLDNGAYDEADGKPWGIALNADAARTLAKNGLTSARNAPRWKEQGSRYTVKRMDVFNSRRSDYSPMLFGDQHEHIYFSSTRNEAQGNELSGITGTKNADIFHSQKDDKGHWSRPEPVSGGLNTDADEGAACFTPDSRTMYLTQCLTDPSYPRYAKIATSNRSDAAWGKPSVVEITRDTLSAYAHPAVSPDGQWLYFTSDMPGGMEPRRTHQHTGQRGVPDIPTQRRPLFFKRRASRHGRTRHFHSLRGQGRQVSSQPSRLSAQLAGRRLRHDIRGRTQPRLLLVEPQRRPRLGSHIQF